MVCGTSLMETNNFEILGLYHPPPSDKNHHMKLQFIDDLVDLYTQLS